MLKIRLFSLCVFLFGFVFTACSTSTNDSQSDGPATYTLAPIVSQTVRFTATPLSTRTPLPTFTYTPTVTPTSPPPSETPVPTSTPEIIGIVNSLQLVNVREGPATTFSAFVALESGTGVLVLGQNSEGTWYEIQLDNGDRGWISASLLRLESTPTPFPTLTPSPDLTALALGTPLPTALFGEGTITPTPPLAAITATPPASVDAENDIEVTSEEGLDGTEVATESFLPIRDPASIYETATALAGGVSIPTSVPNTNATATATGQSPNAQPTPNPDISPTPTTSAPTPVPNSGNTLVQEGIDVFASCNDTSFGLPAPTNIGAGSTVDVYWAWFMRSPDYIDEHLNAVTYEVRVNGTLLSNWRQYGLGTRQQGDSFVKYWFVPFGPLEAGEYTITYRATWSEQVFDGWGYFGPGTGNPIEEGSCDFVVR